MRASTTVGGGRRGCNHGGRDEMSAQEAARLSAALETEEGRRLLQAFLHERADPAARAEQDAYLRQLEREEQGGGLPEGKALVWPRAEGFVAKGRRVRGQQQQEKVFVNVVVSERVAPPSVGGEGGRVWQVPNALGPARVERDHAGALATAFDFLVHPDAAQLAQQDERLRLALMDMAAEAIERAGKGKDGGGWRMQEGFRVLRNRTYVGSTPSPPAMLVDRAALTPEAAAPNPPPSPPAAAAPSTKQPPATSTAQQPQPAPPRYTLTERTTGPAEVSSAAANILPAVPSALAAGSLRRVAPERQRPQELVVRVQLPGVTSAAALFLDLAERELVLECHQPPSPSSSYAPLRLRLPYPVRVGKESASFSQKKGELAVVLPVCPPLPPPPASASVAGAVGGEAGEWTAQPAPQQEQEKQPLPEVNPHARWVGEEETEGERGRLVLDTAEVAAAKARAQGAKQQEQEPEPVAAGPCVTPAYQEEQRPTCFALIVDAAGVDPASVEAAWANEDAEGAGANMDLSFHGGKEERRHYRLRLRLWGKVDAKGCRVDVASRNVLVVVRKARAGETWPRFEAGVGEKGAGAGKLKPALENRHVFELEE